MKILITGVAGFIGSNLGKKLLESNHEVIGIDCFTDYYSHEIKEKNISNLFNYDAFKFYDKDLYLFPIEDICDGVDCIFHLAAQPGVRLSWGNNFDVYVRNNIIVTQKILESIKNHKIKKFIFASSSSVYGNVDKLPISENTATRPNSPYGVTKLDGENLCHLYYKNYGIPVTILRYFSVFGPGQRPDMGFHNFITSIIKEKEIIIYGSGNQTRDFTYIDDVVNANISTLDSDKDGEIINIGGGNRISINDTIKLLQDIIGMKAKIKYVETAKGDVEHTRADISKASRLLGYYPKIGVEEGLKKQYECIKNNYYI
jgi:nucleoside-diphosphate-sugar epimerase